MKSVLKSPDLESPRFEIVQIWKHIEEACMCRYEKEEERDGKLGEREEFEE